MEQVSFEPGMEQWMCDGGWEYDMLRRITS